MYNSADVILPQAFPRGYPAWITGVLKLTHFWQAYSQCYKKKCDYLLIMTLDFIESAARVLCCLLK